MIKQYPHILKVSSVTATELDENGNYVVVGTATNLSLVCRAEPHVNNAGQVATIDGQMIDYGWTVYLPLTSSTIEPGTSVEITDGGLLLARDTVKRYSRGQLNIRIWL